MSAEEYSFYYNNHKRDNAWNEWVADPRYVQNYPRNNEQNYENRPPPNLAYHANTLNHPNYPNHPPHGNRYPPYNTNPRQFWNRYQAPYHQYDSTPPTFPWPRSQGYKRPRQDANENGEHASKTPKKKKKPLSKNVSTKKDWTLEEAKVALDTEKAYNKKSKNALIIKFPDQELNKDIVSQFHSAIENVHFQQPCTPRFCFVTLQESADPDEIIGILNKQKFGQGFLTAEYKKDRDEDQVISPNDIDPLTLYVGNLSQEVTKDDMVNMYPNNRRIDIGFAKKMKFTRYAFIGFRTATESLEAFKKTHSKQMYSKSLIVRFRRLHGTIGMPGEAKPQNPPKTKDDLGESSTHTDIAKSNTDNNSSVEVTDSRSSPGLNDLTDDVQICSNVQIKQERRDSSSSDDEEYFYKSNYSDNYPWNHHPKEIKQESSVKIKTESDIPNEQSFNTKKIKTEINSDVNVKSEPPDSDDDLDISNIYRDDQDTAEDDKEVEDEEELFPDDFEEIYENMIQHNHKVSMIMQNNHIRQT